MKIAYFVNQYPKASHSFIRREILALERQGFEIQRIALRGWAETLPDAQDRDEQSRTRYVLRGGARALVLPTLHALLRSPMRFLRTAILALKMARQSERSAPYHLIYLAEACRMLPWLRDAGVCRIHAHFGTNSTEVAMLAHALGGPEYSFTVHGPDEFAQPMNLPEKIHRASFVVAISSFGRSQLYLRTERAEWGKVQVIHCGLERAFYDIAPVPMTDAPRLVCVGRLCEAKGQLLLVSAVARLAAKGVPVELVLAGDGPMREPIERLIEEYDLQQHIRITGWISGDQVRAELLAARALVLPSFAEGLPVVIMEALALRRPVLSTYVAGIPELVRNGENGWLIPAGALEELTAALEACLSLPIADLQRMGDAGHARVVERHCADIEAAKLARCFGATDG